jgi:hypothetical protein
MRPGASGGGRELIEDFLGFVRINWQGPDDASRVDNARAKERLAPIRVVSVVDGEMVPHRDTTSTVPLEDVVSHHGIIADWISMPAYPDGHLIGITAKGCDVFGDPFECFALIAQTQVCAAVLLELLSLQEAKGIESVIQSDEDDGLTYVDTLPYNGRAIVPLRGSNRPATSVNPHENW